MKFRNLYLGKILIVVYLIILLISLLGFCLCCDGEGQCSHLFLTIILSMLMTILCRESLASLNGMRIVLAWQVFQGFEYYNFWNLNLLL